MFNVGDKVEYTKTRRNARDWYGTVIEVDIEGSRLNVEWVVKGNEIKVQWNPMDRHQVIDVIPVKERKSKKRLRQIKNLDAYENWRWDANCYGKDVNLFCGYGTPRPDDERRKQLEGICNGCKVMTICRIEALQTASVGWWGNMDEPDRVAWGYNVLSEVEGQQVMRTVWIDAETFRMYCEECVDSLTEEGYFFFRGDLLNDGDRVTCTQCEKKVEVW